MDKPLSGAGLHWIGASDNTIVQMLMLGLAALLFVGLIGGIALRFYLSTRHKGDLRLPMGRK
jgi:Na+/H+ antiporter NhaA